MVPMPAAMVLLNALQRQQQEQQARRAAGANILTQSAGSLGAPTYNVQGAQAQQQINAMPSPMAPLFAKLAQQGMYQQNTPQAGLVSRMQTRNRRMRPMQPEEDEFDFNGLWRY